MRWLAVIPVLAALLTAQTAGAQQWVGVETGDDFAFWGVDRSSVRTEPLGPTRAWFIRAIPAVGEDSPDYRLSLEAFDCDRYVRFTETVADYHLDGFGAIRSRHVNQREEVLPGTVGYAMLEAACSDRTFGPARWSERDFVEAFRRDWEAQNWNDLPPYEAGELAPPCMTASFECEIWERDWQGRGLAAGTTVDHMGQVVAR